MGCTIPKPLVVVVHDSDTWRSYLADNRITNKLMVIDFSATRTGTSERMGAYVYSLASRYREVKFITVNADRMPDLVAEYGIEAMPTFVFMRSGKELDRVVGTQEDELLRFIILHK